MKGLKASLESAMFTMSLSVLLAVLAAVPMALWMAGKGVKDWDAVRIGVLPLGIGCVLFALVAFVVPSVAGPRRIAFPLNLTYPVLFAACSLCGSVVLVMAYPPLGLLGDVARFDQVWGSFPVAGGMALYHAVVLTSVAVLSKPEESS
ncbi:MAG: hypothetical protein JST30_03570 [Armatimonadetes bacterium]|nr:hypothetical protein [Armatimonadota bacterium]